MTLSELGDLGDFLGGIGVVITLVYLALQIRQNTEQIRQNSSIVRASATASLAQANKETSALVAKDAEINALFWTGLDRPDDLSEAEYRRFEAVLSVFVQAFTQNYELHREGALTEETWAAQQAAFLWMAERPGFVRFWEQWGGSWPAGAEKLYSEAIARAQADAASSAES